MRSGTLDMTSTVEEKFDNNFLIRNYIGINRSPSKIIEPAFKETWEPSARDLGTKDQTSKFKEEFENFPLGAPLAQFNENYIISQNDDGIVIIDPVSYTHLTLPTNREV